MTAHQSETVNFPKLFVEEATVEGVVGRKNKKIPMPDDTWTKNPKDLDEDGYYQMAGVRKTDENGNVSFKFMSNSEWIDGVENWLDENYGNDPKARDEQADRIYQNAFYSHINPENSVLEIDLAKNETTLEPDDLKSGQKVYIASDGKQFEIFPQTDIGKEMVKKACGFSALNSQH